MGAAVAAAVGLATALGLVFGAAPLPPALGFAVTFAALAPLAVLVDASGALRAAFFAFSGSAIGFLGAALSLGDADPGSAAARSALGGGAVAALVLGVRGLGLRSAWRRALVLAVGWVALEELWAGVTPGHRLAYGLAWNGPVRELAVPFGIAGLSAAAASVGALLGVGRWRTAAIVVAAVHLFGFWQRLATEDLPEGGLVAQRELARGIGAEGGFAAEGGIAREPELTEAERAPVRVAIVALSERTDPSDPRDLSDPRDSSRPQGPPEDPREDRLARYVEASEVALGASEVDLLVWGVRLGREDWERAADFGREARVRIAALGPARRARHVRDTGHFGKDPAGGNAAAGLICYEVTDSERVRGVAASAAPWILVFDGWAGPGCPETAPGPRGRTLREAAAAIRATEWGRAVVFVSEAGSSAVFGPGGSVSRVDVGLRYVSWSERLPSGSPPPAWLARWRPVGVWALLGSIGIGMIGGERVGRRRSRRSRDAGGARGAPR